MKLLTRLAQWDQRNTARLRQSFRRRLTKPGLAVVSGIFISALSGFDTEKSFTHEIFALLCALLSLALLCNWRFSFPFQAERRLPRYGSAGIPVHYQVVIHNASGRLQRGLEVLDHLAETPGPARPFAWVKTERPRLSVGALPTLLPAGQAVSTIELRAPRRGIIRWTRLTVARPDPLGLVRAFQTQPVADQVTILPKRYPLPPIPLPGQTRYQQGGVALAASVGQSDEFVALRDYRPGDPLRHIHWKSWARRGAPVVREFEDEFFVRHALVLDTFAPASAEALFEEAVSVAASFACTVPTQESLLDLLFVGTQAHCFTAGRGVGHTEQLLEVLAAVDLCRERAFTTLIQLVLSHAAQVSGAVLVLLAWDDDRRALVQGLRGLGIPLLVLVVTDAAGAAALRAGPAARDAFHVLVAGDVEKGLALL